MFVMVLTISAVGCDPSIKNAAINGVSNFVTSTVSGTLSALFPIAQMVKG